MYLNVFGLRSQVDLYDTTFTYNDKEVYENVTRRGERVLRAGFGDKWVL